MKTELSLPDVLAQLTNEGLLEQTVDAENILASAEVDETHGSSLPWFIKLFIGLSAWTAAILITSFFFIINLITEEQGFFWGVAFCAVAIALNRLGPSHVFWGQLSLATSLTGQTLAIVGLSQIVDELSTIVVIVTLLESIIIWLHRDAVLRFIAALVVVSFFLVLIFEKDAVDLLHLLIFVLAGVSLYIHWMENGLKVSGLYPLFAPIGSAMTFSFLGILTLPLTDEFDIDWWITAVVLFILLLVPLSQVVFDLGYSLLKPTVIALMIGCTLLLIPSFRMPGILAALLVLIVGFWRQNRGLIGLASLFLAFYVWAYYYSLEWTLLAKSLVLLGSGVLLLALRYFIIRFTPRMGGEA